MCTIYTGVKIMCELMVYLPAMTNFDTIDTIIYTRTFPISDYGKMKPNCGLQFP